MSQPRTCVGCRRADVRSNLVRIAHVESAAVVDIAAVLPGRGAWIHTEDRCLERALISCAFDRAFRLRGVDVSAVTELRVSVSGTTVFESETKESG